MSEVYPSRTWSISIQCPPERVYAYVYDLRHFPAWAVSFGLSSIEASEGKGVIETPEGPLTMQFVPKNTLGVLDHDVTLPSGEINRIPMRVIANGTGSEVLFTLFRLPGVSEEAFQRDQVMVERDLLSLKGIMEN
ncbi:hypothetical protein [Paenibacillus rigui]|uniref:Polyketide cyclase n=1 Tax=Paenibacillus rigui TaxID=554312 RepID=A0A229UQG3_9BACL|nr:hypothetical protein [Paenibacillus rigui]OXM85696.1 polyketide cyclase [Paenibacillus rigui]